MEDFLSYLISSSMALILTCLVVLTKKGYAVLTEKHNEVYDNNRNRKIDQLVKLVHTNIDVAIKAFFVESEISEIDDEDISKLVMEVVTKIETLTGNGVISYLMDSFVDNWDEWIHEMVLARIREMQEAA